MQNYLDMMRKIHIEGTDILNERTGIVCRLLVGETLTYDLSKGDFPAITTKKLAFKNMRGELLGFFRGYTNAAQYRKLGCTIWDDNANKTKAWVDNPFRKCEDDLGPIYAKQWTEWDNYHETTDRHLASTLMKDNSYILISCTNNNYVFKRTINQLEVALKKLITDPSDRRIIVTGWNPGDMDKCALPACHTNYNFISVNRVLHVNMTLRSADVFLGTPFNIASTALFLRIMARLSGHTPGKVIIHLDNAHIYSNHFDAVSEQLKNPVLPPPSLWLSDDIKPITDYDDIKGAFERIQPNDIELMNYQSAGSISAEMAT